MLLEPGEREQAPDRVRARLQAHGGAASFDLIAEDEECVRVVGWLSVAVLPFRRARHCGYVVIGVDAPAAGRGLLAAAEHEASGRGCADLS
jgi:hypothetical protein